MCAKSQPSIVSSDPYNDPYGDEMQFRLTYEGILLGSNSTDTRAEHKHAVRKVFHPQLKRLWALTQHLSSAAEPLPLPRIYINSDFGPPRKSRLQALADQFVSGDLHFVPLATRELSLICGIDILFLRPDYPGGIVRSADIDNRLKTLFDALRIPELRELAGPWAKPAEDENPFFVLLEDDDLISKISVDTDMLLQPTGSQPNNNDSRVIITVKLRPSQMKWDNIVFG